MLETLPWRWAAAAARRPVLTLVLLGLAVVAAAPGLLRLELRTDGHALVPPNHPQVRFDHEVREHFGLRDPLVVVVESRRPAGLFDPATLRIVARLSSEIAALPGLEPGDVTSLATEHRDRVYPGTLHFRPYLDPLPETPAALAELEGDLDAAEVLDGTLVSFDRKAVAILVGVPPAAAGRFDRAAFYHRVEAMAARYQTADDRLFVVGAPAAEALLGEHILSDLALLLPLAIATISFFLWRGTRRLAVLAIAGLEITATQVFTFGLMGWTGSPVYLTTAILPVILTTVALADEIHLFFTYQRHLGREDESAEPHGALFATLREIARPVCLTSLTNAAGFLSFLTSSITAVRFFGLFAAAGILFSMLWTLLAVPALLALVSPERFRPRVRAQASPHAGLLGLLRRAVERPRAALAGLAVATVLLGLGAFRLHVQDSWIDGFAVGSPFHRDTEQANGMFAGTHLLWLHLSFPPEPPTPADDPEDFGWEGRTQGPLLAPERLRAIGDLEAFARRQDGVGGVLGTYSQLTTVAYLWQGRRPGSRVIPDHPKRVAQLLERFDEGRGEKRRREVIDDARRETLVTVFLKDANFQDTARLMASLQGFAAEHLAPLGGTLRFAGDVAVSQAMIPAIVNTQVGSVLSAPLSCLLVIALLYRSLRTGLLAVLPAACAVLWMFGAMGWLGIPLGVATSMFCAITLGIAVDYAIHYLERHQALSAEGAADPALAALLETGPAILADTLAISVGFGLLAFSQVPANRRLGLLVAFALLSGSLLALVGLTSLARLRARHPRAKL